MAGAGYKLFNTGDVLTAQQVNEYLQQQVTMVFANATARTSALSGVLAEGMMSYLQDTNLVEVYDGSNWVSVGNTGDITGVTAGTGISGGGTSGTVTITNSMATAIDAKGDLIVGTGADTFDRLAVGTNGHTLVADSSTSTGLKWAAAERPGFVGCMLAKTSQQTTTAFAYTAITFTQEDVDTNGFHNNSTNTSRITIPSGYAGKYEFTAFASASGAGDNTHTCAIAKNGTNQCTVGGWRGPSTGDGNYTVSIILDLAVGDYVEFMVYQQVAATLNSTAQNARPTYFYAEYLGA